MSHSPKHLEITATVPLIQPPTWAVLQRHLIDVLRDAWQEFVDTCCEPDGSLRYSGPQEDRDGVDDFYEAFFNWPILYLIAGDEELLTQVKQSWEGVTRQLTDSGYLVDEFERGYDWFHQGESLILFYALCAADPADEAFRERALRFAELYLPGSPTVNYDATRRMIVAPHNGAGGPRWGLGEAWKVYSGPALENMRRWGLPLRDVEGIETWDDLADPGNARRMGEAMQQRLGRGDVTANLSSTSLAANAWLYSHDPRLADWIHEYVTAWSERAAANGGIVPDNVGPSGEVGELHGGRWYGGHYGWTWPHGFHSVEPPVLIAGINDKLVNGADEGLGMARDTLATVLAEARIAELPPEQVGRAPEWRQLLDADDGKTYQLVPHRYGCDGWFEWLPLSPAIPTWLWWTSGEQRDLDTVEQLRDNAGYPWTRMRQFRDKEEAGHEPEWFSWLRGDYPDYPEDSLRVALGQVAHRLALLRKEGGLQENDLHWWQRVNPVVTEVLSQQVHGAPAALYNGGLPLARIRYWDAETEAPGLPRDVSALVRSISDVAVSVTLVNIGARFDRSLLLQAGMYGEDLIESVTHDRRDLEWPGPTRTYSPLVDIPTVLTDAEADSNRVRVILPALSTIDLTLRISRRALLPQHQTYSTEPRWRSS